MPDDEGAGNAPAISPEHQETLIGSAINPQIAARWGIKTVRTPDDLPPDASDLADKVPGLLFPLPTLLGGEIVYQIRRDDPPKDRDGKTLGKYVTSPGSQPPLMAWPPDQTHYDARNDPGQPWHSTIIVEGTKQTLAVSLLNIPGCIVVGITGCQNWRSPKTSDNPDATIDGIPEVARDKRVYVIFDADIRTNPNVHQAAVEFDRVLRDLGAREVLWCDVPPVDGQKTGIDDYLGHVEPDKRVAAFRNQVLKRARKKVPPLQGDTSNNDLLKEFLDADLPVPDEDAVAFYKYRVKADGTIAKTLVFDALARIVTVSQIKDDLLSRSDEDRDKPIETLYQLEITSRHLPNGPERIWISAQDLANIGSWIHYLPNGASGRIIIPSNANAREALANAIRRYRSDEQQLITGLARPGWYLHGGVPVYVAQRMAIGPLGKVEDIIGDLSGPARKISFPDPSQYSDVDLANSVKTTISTMHVIHRRVIWKLLVGAAAYAAAGFQTNGSIYLFGPPGSGKTSLAKGVAMLFSPQFGPPDGEALTIDSTNAAIEASVLSFHHAIALVDDARSTDSASANDSLKRAIDMLSRIGYSGGSATRRRAGWNSKSNRLSMSDTRNSRPFIVITAELQPFGEDTKSQVDRMLIVRVETTDTFYSLDEFKEAYGSRTLIGMPHPDSGIRTLETYARNRTFNLAMAGYLRWIANQMLEYFETERGRQYGDPLTAWQTGFYDERMSDIEQRLDHRLSVRTRRNVAQYIFGWYLWCDYARSVGAISDDEYGAYVSSFFSPLDGKGELIELLQEYIDNSLTSESTLEAMVESIFALVASGKMAILGHEFAPEGWDVPRQVLSNAPIGGTWTHKQNRKHEPPGLWIIPAVVGQLLHRPANEIRRVLEVDKSVEVARLTFQGVRVRGLWLPLKLLERVSMNKPELQLIEPEYDPSIFSLPPED